MMCAMRKPTSVGGEELAGALAGTFGELVQQVFVGATEEVGLHVGKAEPIARIGKGLDDGGELGRVDVALAIALGREIDKVDDARTARDFAALLPARPLSNARRCPLAGC